MCSGESIKLYPPEIDSRGFVYANGVRLLRIKDGALIFLDRRKHASLARGTNQVAVSIDDLTALMVQADGG